MILVKRRYEEVLTKSLELVLCQAFLVETFVTCIIPWNLAGDEIFDSVQTQTLFSLSDGE